MQLAWAGLQERSNLVGGFLRCDDHVDFEVDEIFPVGHPFVEETTVVCFHELIAALQPVIDPTGDVVQAFGCHSTFVSKAAIYGYRILVLEVLHDHV